MLEKGMGPDEVCHGLAFCTDPQCKMYPNNKADLSAVPRFNIKSKAAPSFDPWQWLIDIFNRVAAHKPILDIDGDFYSSEPYLRGSDWRGRDCSDTDANTHPGRKPIDGDQYSDHKCNGM
jgi:acyloxyacyl hydrolase